MQDNYKLVRYEGLAEYAIFKQTPDSQECKLHKTEIADAFCTYGGGFVKCLGDALYHADHINSNKLINTRAGYVEEYVNKFIFPTKPYCKEIHLESNNT